MTKFGQCSQCGLMKKLVTKNKCNTCYQRNLRESGYRPPRMYVKKTCEILTNHKSDLIEDTERLSTKFILNEIEQHKKSRK